MAAVSLNNNKILIRKVKFLKGLQEKRNMVETTQTRKLHKINNLDGVIMYKTKSYGKSNVRILEDRK